MDRSLIDITTLKGWKVAHNTVSSQDPIHINASGFPLTEHDNPFDLFFPESILSQICNFTNESYSISIKTKKIHSSVIKDWYPLTIDELKTYFGVILMMGIDKKPEISQYWSTNGLLSSSLISKSMSINRFFAINKFLEVGPTVKGQRLARLNFLSSHIQSVSQSLYFPSKKLSIGKSLIALKGRHFLNHLTSMKAHKWNFNAFVLCEPETGYCIKHLFCDGSKEENIKPNSVAKKLSEGLEHSNYHIFADNWLTSIDLVKDFKVLGISFTGSIKSSGKGIPKIDKLKKELNDKKILFLIKDGLNLVLWEDKYTVSMISNVIDTEALLESRIGKSGIKKDFYMPKMIKEHRKYVKGVDLLDQRFIFYCYDRYFKKWWKYFFLYLFEIALNNIFVIQNKGRCAMGKPLLSYADHRIDLIKFLVNWKEIEIDNGICDVDYRHYLIKGETKTCFICYRERKKSKCTYFCSGCGEFMHQECFLVEHKLLK